MKYGNVLIKNPINKLTMQMVDIYPPNDLATELSTGEHEQETEEEMLERVQREEDSFEDFSSASDEE
jgi:hypothetical protein